MWFNTAWAATGLAEEQFPWWQCTRSPFTLESDWISASSCFWLESPAFGAIPHCLVGCANQPLRPARLQSRGEPRLDQPSNLASGRKHHLFGSLARGFRQGQKAELLLWDKRSWRRRKPHDGSTGGAKSQESHAFLFTGEGRCLIQNKGCLFLLGYSLWVCNKLFL